MIKTYATLLGEVKKQKPLIHHITNYVTVNDCANITLSIGASPVMADCQGEAAEIAGIASALVINMGTLNSSTIPSMIAAGEVANAKGIPVVFDPVGAGASRLRNETAMRIINELKLRVLRGNISEIKFVSGLQSKTKGVDASDADKGDTGSAAKLAKELAQKLGCIVVISGEVDAVSDGAKTVLVENGHPWLGNLTGTGCMCSSLIGSFCGAVHDEPFSASVAAMATMGICGELAYEKAGHLGSGSFHEALRDAVSQMDQPTFERLAKIREQD